MDEVQLPHHRKLLLLSTLTPAQSPVAGVTITNNSSESTLDFNVIVIIAAMLCALVCALGLNSMLQCVVRCTHRILTEPVEWVVSRRMNAGLKKEDVVAIPTATYATSGSPTSASGCAICLADFSDGDKVRVLPTCNHRFHVGCIDTWLLSHSSCPTCRHRLSVHDSAHPLEIVRAP